MRAITITAVLLASFGVAIAAHAQKKYGPGASDTEIKIGNTSPYSGPASAFGAGGKAAAAYFAEVNDHGGVNGRKIVFISLDDAFSPPKTVQQTRRLIEEDHVLALCCSGGTAANLSIQKYITEKKVPQLFVGSGATQFSDPEHHPWSLAFLPNYRSEGRIFAKYITSNVPDPKIGIFYQDDDSSKEYIRGLKAAFGDDATKLIVKEASYELTDATIDSQIISLQESGANVFLNLSTPKFAAMAISKIHDLGWKPLQILFSAAATISGTLKPAGLDNSIGIVSGVYFQDPADPEWRSDPGVLAYLAFAKKYVPQLDPFDSSLRLGYVMAEAMTYVLKQAGDDLTRENIMRQAVNLKDVELPMLLPGIKMNTSASNFSPIHQMQLQRFDGTNWMRFGNILSP